MLARRRKHEPQASSEVEGLIRVIPDAGAPAPVPRWDKSRRPPRNGA
ncbi:MAG: hypothetical protein AVDCRST_MAG72-2062 [uncultured Nocardioidaceae bacterium]|uniref:Uncharacterized protein n=1 Tax=uncultured Nocardioidaceae bacterium TaxID=253824 RepID=A0A6J4MJD8_9ACTN|nr:MAG: hypothetical protein AVDCRST_MAG72-2062 [uncultured Nocardioidaceae bacterium]